MVPVDFPVIGVTFKHKFLSRNILLESKRPHSGDLRRWRVQAPRLCKSSFSVSVFEQMTGKYINAVEKSFSSCIRTCQIEDKGFVIAFVDGYGLATDDE